MYLKLFVVLQFAMPFKNNSKSFSSLLCHSLRVYLSFLIEYFPFQINQNEYEITEHFPSSDCGSIRYI